MEDNDLKDAVRLEMMKRECTKMLAVRLIKEIRVVAKTSGTDNAELLESKEDIPLRIDESTGATASGAMRVIFG